MKTTNHRRPVKGINKCVRIPAEEVFLLGDLQVPEEATALVLFAHGGGRGRNNPRNQHVARILRSCGIGTLMSDLLTESEEVEDEASEQYRHDAELLARRLVEVTRWVRAEPAVMEMPLGYFGACAGGAAALIAAARMKSGVGAVVSRGGRVDLAIKSLPRVKFPTLLIVGGDDTVGLELNREALPRLSCTKKLVEVPGASHLFGEPGKLEEVAKLSTAWFQRHLSGSKGPL